MPAQHMLLTSQTTVWEKGNMSASVIITGATSGIGLQFARRIAATGLASTEGFAPADNPAVADDCTIVIAGRRGELLEQRADELRGYGVTVDTVTGDLADEAVLGSLIERARSCTTLINCAGYGHGGHVADVEPGELLRMMRVHQDSAVRLIRAALPAMRAAHRGLIINVGSLAGRAPVPGGAVYSATKAFLERFSESVALENARHGIVVQVLLPGFVRTDFHRNDDPATPYRRRRAGWMSPEAVVSVSLRRARRAARRLARRPAAVPRARDTVVVTGGIYRALSGVARLLPRTTTYRASLTFERRNRS